MTNDTQKLIDQYNKSVQSIKEQELAIDKVKQKLDYLNEYKNSPGIELEDTEYMEIDNLTRKLDLMNGKLNDSKDHASELGQKIEESMNQKHVSQFGYRIDEIGNKLEKFKIKMTRLASTAMVFSLLRNQLTSLRNNLITLLKTDNQFASSLNQIKANLMAAFVPIYNACLPAINALMNALSKVTGTLAIFISNLFGGGIKNATKDAKKLSGALNKVNGSAKKASGSLASFDNLEVIADNTSSGGTGSSSSQIDFSGEIPYSQRLLDFLNKIKDVLVKNKDFLIEIAKWVGLAFAISKVIAFFSAFAPLLSLLKKLSTLLQTVWGLIKNLGALKGFKSLTGGILLAVAGFVVMIKNISELIMNWDKLDKKQKLIKVGMAALGVAAITLGYSIATGISAATLGIGALIALIATLITAIVSLTIKFATEKDAILSTKDAQEQLTQAQENYANANNEYINAVDNAESALNTLEDAEKRTGLSGEALYNAVQNGTLSYAEMNSKQKEVYKAYLENDSAQKKLSESTENLTNAKKAETDASFQNQLAIAAETGNYDDYKKSVIEAYKNGTLSAEDARDKLEQAMSRMSDKTQQTFMEDIPNDIKNGMDPDKYQTHWQKFKNWWGTGISKLGDMFNTFFTETLPNGLSKLGNAIKTFFTKTVPNVVLGALESIINSIISAFEGLINKPIKAINKIISTANEIPGVNISKFTETKLGRITLPRLAKGTVIPPRHEFAAILGDQKHGTNIEAPLDTIKQANREVLEEVLGRIGINGQDREIVLKNWQFILQFGNTTLGKIIIDEIRKYEKETNTQFLLA